MKHKIKKSIGVLILTMFLVPPGISKGNSSEIIYPLKKVSKFACKYEDFSKLGSNCIEDLKILHTKDYKKYATADGGFNYYTRRYTVLWASSYKYGWDVGHGGHMGVDIATAKGTPVYAMAKGKVIIATKKMGFGNMVSIKHTINGKKIVSNYAHLSKINVSVGETVNVGKKIGEVGSTGNSTGNHLHFQIDFDYNKSPAYYSYSACPYTYMDIVQNGKCFGELKRLTVDPLKFLETSGAVLNDIETSEIPTKISTKNTNTKKSGTRNYVSGKASEVFNKTIYTDSEFDDIVEVQKVFRNLGYYKGKIDGNYFSLIPTITKYQLEKKVIDSKADPGAGYFGPKTRIQAKKDYNAYLNKTSIKNRVETKTNDKIEKISRSSILTREEIEKRELREFENKYNIEIKNNNIGNNIPVGKTKNLTLSIEKQSGIGYRGNTPYPITFIVDRTKIKVFPEKFYNFTDGERKISLTGLKPGKTTLFIKMGTKTLKSITLEVYNNKKKTVAKNGVVIAKSKVILGDKNIGVVMFKDGNGNRLINREFEGKFDLKVEGNGKICVKSGDIKNIRNILRSECRKYVKNKVITYEDTVGGLLLFDYKIFDKKSNIKLYSFSVKKDLVKLDIKTNPPKGLNTKYVYYDEVIKMLENNTLTPALKQGHFLEQRSLTKRDAVDWIKNTLYVMEKNTNDYNVKSIIKSNLKEIENESKSNTVITRKELLDKAYKYLVFEKTPQLTINYQDLGEDDNIKANSIFDKNNTWKDRFGNKYYQPEQKITRGEGAYLLANAFNKTQKVMLSYQN